jgi:hypothetical protein
MASHYEIQIGTWAGWYWIASTVPIGTFSTRDTTPPDNWLDALINARPQR